MTKEASDALHEAGSERIPLSLKVDIRYDREITMDSKMRSVGE